MPDTNGKWLKGAGTTGYLHVRNITRLFLVSDYNGKTDIKASTIGPANPFTVEVYETEETAERALANLIEWLEQGRSA